MKILHTGVVKNPGVQENIQSGWIAKLAYDEEDTGGYYLLFFNPDKVGDGFDNWFLTKQDALLNLDDWEMKISWNSSPA